MPTKVLGAWAVMVCSMTVIALTCAGSCGAADPKPFYQCPDDYRPKDSFVETCVASRTYFVGEPLQVKLDCLSYAAMHGYCEAITP